MSRFWNCQISFLALVLFALCWGCGKTPVIRPDWAIVSGVVTFQGKPLPGGAVMWCTTTDPVVLRGGTIQQDGAFTLEAPVGKAKIAIHTGDMKTVNPSRFVEIPAKYADPEKSGISYEVSAGENKDVRIDLK